MNKYQAFIERLINEKRLGKKESPARGQIWAVNREVTYPDGRKLLLPPDSIRPGMVLLLGLDEDVETNPNSVIRVLPVSTKWIFASPLDLAFGPPNSPVAKIGLMIECWNPRSMLRVNLLAPLGHSNEAILEDVGYLLHCALNEQKPDQPLKSKGYVGPPIESKTDPRWKFRREQVEKSKFLNAPVNFLLWGAHPKSKPSIFTAAQEWIASVIEWSHSNPAPALAKTTKRVSTLLKSAGPPWRVGEILGAEIAVLPLEGQLWLSYSDKIANNLQLLSLTVDRQAIAAPEPLHGKDLMLVPLGLPSISRAEMEITDEKQHHILIIKFGSKGPRSRKPRKRG
jgi:hypothetical protein